MSEDLNLSLDNENLTTENMIESSINELPENVPGITDHLDDAFQSEPPKTEISDNTETNTETESEPEPENNNPFNEVETEFQEESKPTDFNKSAENVLDIYNLAASEIIGPALALKTDELELLLVQNGLKSKQTDNFLNVCEKINVEIANIPVLNDEEKAKIKDPLADVLKILNVKTENPYMKLLITVSIIGAKKYIAIKSFQNHQNNLYANLIEEIKNVSKNNNFTIPKEIKKPMRVGFLNKAKSFITGLFHKSNEN